MAREAQARATDLEYEAYCKLGDPGRKTASLASFRTYPNATLGRVEFRLPRLLNPMRVVHW